MGGRGSSSPGNVAFLTPAELEALPYNVAGYDDSRGGAVFPFLEQTGRAWRILTRPVTNLSEPHPAHTFGLDAPTLRWVNGEQVSDLYDDALWLHPFTDHDGERKVLAWRRPNQAGEYVILTPTADSHPLPWTRAGGEALTAVPRYPQADSRQMPPRIDFTNPAYLGLVDASSAGGLGEGEAYSVAVMEAAIDRAVANRGALGMYCNSLMLNKALYGRLPEHPPAPLEDIIDSAVKTGADLSRVVAWNYANSHEILERRERIPILLHQRLSIDYRDEENRPPPPRMSTDHWLDRLEAGIRIHIQEMIHKRDELAQRAVPSPALFASVAGDPAALELGAGLNQAYAGALSMGRKRARAMCWNEPGMR